jgi:hypothetical protein
VVKITDQIIDMKKLIFAVFVFILAASAGGNAKEKKREPDVKGGYRECTVYKYGYFLIMLDVESKRIYQNIRYNEKGFKIEQKTHDIVLNLSNHETYNYDVKGNLIELLEFGYSDSIVYEKQKFVYDDYNNLLEINFYIKDTFEFKIIYKYDKYGHQIEELYIIKDSTIEQQIIYKYDDSGNLIEKLSCKFNYPDNYKLTYKNDQNGKVVEELSYHYNKYSNSKLFKRYKYNIDGFLIETLEYNNEDKINWKESYKYDEFGNLIEKKYYKNLYDAVSKFVYIYSK